MTYEIPPAGDRDMAPQRIRAAFDAALNRGGFERNRGDLYQPVKMLYEAMPEDAFARAPRVADQLDHEDARCFDGWVTYDPAVDRIEVDVEGGTLPSLLRRLGHEDAAAAVERPAATFDEQLRTYAAAFETLFGS